MTEKPLVLPLPPREGEAERALLGACMESTNAYRDAAGLVTAGDFYEERNRHIWRAMESLATEGATTDPVLLANRLRRDGVLTLSGGGPYLHELYSGARLSAGSTAYFAQIVADVATRRRVFEAGQRMIQRAHAGTGDTFSLVEDSLEDVRSARDQRAGVDVLTSTVDEFMHSVPDDVDWVVPGLLGRGDRLVLTGSGGLGKSTLLRQIAVCAAAGIDPLDWQHGEAYAPVKVTLIDCENADHQLKTALWQMVHEAKLAGQPVEDRLRIGGHGNPLNLLDASSALSLLRTIDHDKPDLVYIGPAYKLHNDDPDKESVVKRITHVLDQIRATGCAVVTEAHHTKGAKTGGSLEPSGSNLWTWWPEFGRGLRLVPDTSHEVRMCALESWRIDRVQRDWPECVQHGGRWPWARAKTNPYYSIGGGA